MRTREEAGVIGDDGYFRTIVARLIEYTILELHKYVWIFFESGVKVPVVTLRLGAGLCIPSVAFRHSCCEWIGYYPSKMIRGEE